MPVERIPLLGEYNTRGVTDASPADGKDYRLVNFVPRLVADELSKKLTPYIERRSGFASIFTSSNSTGSALFFSPAFGTPVICRDVGASGLSTVWLGNNTVGTADALIKSIAEGRFSSMAFLMFITGSSGWYLAYDAPDVTAYTADGNNSTTITDIKIAGVASVAGLYVGQKLSAASNITAGSRIVSINSGAFSAVLSAATTGGAFNDLAITKEPIAKIIDADFPAAANGMVEMDGRAYAIASAGNSVRVYESDLNAIASWPASGFVTLDVTIAGFPSIAKLHNRLYAMAGNRIEVYYNAGNQSGATISRIDEATIDMGAVNFCATEMAVYFVGMVDGAYSGLFRITPSGLDKISTPTLDSILASTDQQGLTAPAPPSAFQMWGQTCVYVQMGTATGIIFYVEAKKIGEFGGPAPLLFSGSVAVQGQSAAVYYMDTTTGTVYRALAQSPVYQDGGSTFTATVQTAKGTRGSQKRKFAHALRLICDRYSSGTVTVYVCDSDDGSYTYIGTFDLTVMNPVIYRCGFYYGRSYKLEHAVNGPFRAIALEEEYEVCSV